MLLGQKLFKTHSGTVQTTQGHQKQNKNKTVVQTSAYIFHMILHKLCEVGSHDLATLQSRKLRLRKVSPRKFMTELGLELKFPDS
jgi:hypothetical protein